MAEFIPIHQHALYKLTNLETTSLSLTCSRSFLRFMVGILGMVPVTSPQVKYVKDLGNEGLTGSINLSTSHIAFHIWDKQRMMMLDVYSCKEFLPDLPLMVVEKFFGSFEIDKLILIDRDTGKINFTGDLTLK